MDYTVNSIDLEGLVIEVNTKEEIEKKRFGKMFLAIRMQAGMNRKEFAEWLGIPYRTMQDWELGVSQVPEYVLRLVAYKVSNELKKENL